MAGEGAGGGPTVDRSCFYETHLLFSLDTVCDGRRVQSDKLRKQNVKSQAGGDSLQGAIHASFKACGLSSYSEPGSVLDNEDLGKNELTF